MEKLVQIKDKGNQFFKQKKFTQAIQQFNTVIHQLEDDQSKKYLSADTQEGKLYVIALINAGFACINMKDLKRYDQAIQYCNKALGVDSKNVKGLYRRGLAKKQKAQKLQVENGAELDEILLVYESSKKDFEDLCLVDKNNELATKNLSLVVKDIYRVTVAKGQNVKLSGSSTTKQQKSSKSPYEISQSDKPKRKGKDMEKIMKDYKIQQVTQMVQDKVRKQYLVDPLPRLRSDLEKAIRTIQKNEEIYVKFVYRVTDQYLKKIQPTFDILAGLTDIVCNKGEGQEAQKVLKAIKNQKSFNLYWKSLTKKQRQQIKKKWVDLGLSEQQLK